MDHGTMLLALRACRVLAAMRLEVLRVTDPLSLACKQGLSNIPDI